jgi:outer membrane protein OmpA-like peptidoglycan-associated protein
MKQLVVIIALLFCTTAALAQQDEIRRSIYFGGGSYTVDDGQLIELYQWLDSIPNLLDKFDIHLISQTDPIGGREYNEWLSKMRSETVQELLQEHDIPDHKITIKDWAFDNPVYSNTTYQGMEMNRRVDVILYPIIF